MYHLAYLGVKRGATKYYRPLPFLHGSTYQLVPKHPYLFPYDQGSIDPPSPSLYTTHLRVALERYIDHSYTYAPDRIDTLPTCLPVLRMRMAIEKRKSITNQ